MPRFLTAWWVSGQQRYKRWLDRRIPPRISLQLNQRNLFIFLSRHGLYFLLVVLLVWIGATNFQNNLAFALSFFLLAIMFVAIHMTFANASGLRIRFIDAEPVFSGDVAHARFELCSTASHRQLEFSWPQQESTWAAVQPSIPEVILLPQKTHRRGLLSPGRFRLQTFYPLGIVRCWSWLDLDVTFLVYPKPEEADFRQCSSSDGDEDGGVIAGGDEYFALKSYSEGESLSRIAWKQFAAGRGLFVREYAELSGGTVMLDLSVMTEQDLEVKLSKLCYCAIKLHEAGRVYGLRLPNQTVIDAASGDQQLHLVLSALALYQ
ncbi:MAG TPA: DUF58 domain-containing protein [Pseudomonadales bacterium]|nr:DUF58 domain-containing protein [Pseudomonadales bacterium]